MSLVDLPYRAQLDERGSPIVVYFDPDYYDDDSRSIYPGELIFTEKSAPLWVGTDEVQHLRVFSNAKCFKSGKTYVPVGVSISYLRIDKKFHENDALFTATIDGILTVICPEQQMDHATIGDYVCVEYKPINQRFALHHESHYTPKFHFQKKVVITENAYESFKNVLEKLTAGETITATFMGPFTFPSSSTPTPIHLEQFDCVGRVINIDREDNHFRISLLL